MCRGHDIGRRRAGTLQIALATSHASALPAALPVRDEPAHGVQAAEPVAVAMRAAEVLLHLPPAWMSRVGSDSDVVACRPGLPAPARACDGALWPNPLRLPPPPPLCAALGRTRHRRPAQQTRRGRRARARCRARGTRASRRQALRAPSSTAYAEWPRWRVGNSTLTTLTGARGNGSGSHPDLGRCPGRISRGRVTETCAAPSQLATRHGTPVPVLAPPFTCGVAAHLREVVEVLRGQPAEWDV